MKRAAPAAATGGSARQAGDLATRRTARGPAPLDT